MSRFNGYQFPMGKVKSILTTTEISDMEKEYQFPMGKVKESLRHNY